MPAGCGILTLEVGAGACAKAVMLRQMKSTTTSKFRDDTVKIPPDIEHPPVFLRVSHDERSNLSSLSGPQNFGVVMLI
jgi:hypothetical protein